MKTILLIISISLLFADINIVDENLNLKKRGIKSWMDFKNQNVVKQKHDYSCGSASLATILRYFYNLNISERDILKEVISNKKGKIYKNIGLSFFELGEFVKRRGFKAIGLALNIDSLKNLKIPVIIYVKIRRDTHFTVFRGVDRKFVYLADPSLGNIKVRLSKFKEMFYGVDELKYRGKILAILPKNRDIKTNREFLKKRDSSNINYKILILNQLFN
jgi:predicted double-glycine peptidase